MHGHTSITYVRRVRPSKIVRGRVSVEIVRTRVWTLAMRDLRPILRSCIIRPDAWADSPASYAVAGW